MTRIVQPTAVQLTLPVQGDGIALERVYGAHASWSEYAAFWARHYTGSRGAIGRQFHHVVRLDGRAIGIIAAGEPMYRSRRRDRYFGLSYDSPDEPPPRWLCNCIAFRLEDAPWGVASSVLALWREEMRELWGAEGFETLVGLPRSGACFRHDGWRKVGYTAGLGARRPEGHGHTKRKIVQTDRKMILCRRAS